MVRFIKLIASVPFFSDFLKKNYENFGYLFNATFMFDYNWATMTPVKHESDSKHLTDTCKKLEQGRGI